jgi:parallel beta-helix repeat protein
MFVAFLLIVSAFSLAVTTLPVNVRASTLYVGGSGPGNYTTIQSAIDKAMPGNTIYVFNGVYPERIEVNKTLSLVGEDREGTIIVDIGMVEGYVVNVTADWVNFTGFKVIGNDVQTYAGIRLAGVRDCFIASNNVSNVSRTFRSGILLGSSDNNIVTDNVLWNNYNGIEIEFSSSGNDIVGNTILTSHMHGIMLLDTHNNTIANNFVSRNNHGIRLSFSTDNILANNTAIDNVQDGIFLRDSYSNVVIDNDLSSNHCGIWIFTSDNNTVSNNNAWNNDNGIWSIVSDSTIIAYNAFTSNNQYGILLEASTNNTIHHNNFINNSQQASDDFDTNQWDDGYPSGGNYWSNYTGVDVFSGPNQDIPGSDGKGDTPYVIDADSEDRYPLVAPVPSPPSAPLNLSVSAGDQKVILTWEAPAFDGNSSITSFRVFRGFSPGIRLFLAEIGNVLTYTDTFALTNGQTYYYVVTAKNAIGEGPQSNEVNATPTSVPGAPLIRATLGGINYEHVTLNWTLSSDDGSGQNSVVEYRIYRHTVFDATGASYGLIASVPNGTSEFIDSLAGEGDPNNYFYRVCAVDLNNQITYAQKQGGKFTQSLSKGLALVSYPLFQVDKSLEVVLQTVSYDKAWSYDFFSREWISFAERKPYNASLLDVYFFMGLWIHVTDESNFTVAGTVPGQSTIQLSAGWNLVGFPSLNTTYAVAELKQRTGATRVEGFDPSTSPYNLKALQDTDVLQTGHGYWIYSPTGSIWVVNIT